MTHARIVHVPLRPLPHPLLVLLLALAVVQAPARAGWFSSSPKPPAVLKAFLQREKLTKAQLPHITAVAEFAADRVAAHSKTLINVPYSEQPSGFAEEILNRAGGLANALPSVERPQMVTPRDIVLFNVRSWETDGAATRKWLQEYHASGWSIILFASKKGLPADLPVDYLIDNGAAGPGADEAAVNALANILNAWVWTCEYAGALTRHGKAPGILASMLLPEAERHNGFFQSPQGRLALLDCGVAVPAGKLGSVYLARVEALCKILAGKTVQGQLRTAADLAAARLAVGGKVGVATCEHFLMDEIFRGNRSPFQPFNVVWRAKDAFPQNLKDGDLLLWFGYIGMSTPLEDYGGCIRQTKAQFIACYVPDRQNPANNAPDALCVIEQNWKLGDAEVAIPFKPGRMAPVSGLDQGLLYRMLDDAVARKLAALKK